MIYFDFLTDSFSGPDRPQFRGVPILEWFKGFQVLGFDNVVHYRLDTGDGVFIAVKRNKHGQLYTVTRQLPHTAPAGPSDLAKFWLEVLLELVQQIQWIEGATPENTH